jgi:small-conductance mechanosensitive channel
MTTPTLRWCSALWHVLRLIGMRTGASSGIARCLIAACAAMVILCSAAFTQAAKGDSVGLAGAADSSAIENPGVPVEIDGRAVIFVYAQIAGFTPQERAEAIQQRIVALANKRSVALEAIHAEDRGTWTEILADNNRIMGLTEADAAAAERKRPELAAEYAEVIRQVVKQYREDHTWPHVLWGVLYAAVATGALVTLLFVCFWIRGRLRTRVERWLVPSADASAQPLRPRLVGYLGRPLITLSRAAFWIFILALVQAYGTVVLGFFPSTKYTSYRITSWLFSELGGFGKLVIDYIPNLILIFFICLVVSYLIKLNEYIFGEIRDQKLTIKGFYSDWAEPTAKLVRVLILAAGAIVAFPYLPGSESPAFKGISVFLGVLLSLGSTSAVAHGVAGTILTYMRAFQVGDFVRIGSDVGEVVEKTLLVTRILTQKKEIVTIPNGTVLGGVVVNYSAEARNTGVIFHTTVTIGYNAPWRQVHELLTTAALATDDIRHDPRPFVLQTALNDFYVAYELNAYTDKPKNMQNIYSVLHQNIQDKFNEAGVEINSPHYTSLRDGNQTTIPENYLADDYQSPVFVMQEINGSEMVRKTTKRSQKELQPGGIQDDFQAKSKVKRASGS